MKKMPTENNKKSVPASENPNKGLPKFSCFIQDKISSLAVLLGTYELAKNLFLDITSNVNGERHKQTHLKFSLKIIKFHYELTIGDELKNLSAFQNSLINYFNSVTVEGELPPHLANITKKIYSHFLSTDYFIHDIKANEFNIFDICPQSGSDVTAQLNLALISDCPNKKILNATKLFIRSKKVEKNYLRVFASTFKEISKIDKDWSQSAIEQGIKNFRDSYDTELGSINTKYHETSRAIELFQNLKDIGLLDKNIRLPKNIKKPSKSSLMRNISRSIDELTQVNKKTVQTITSELNHLFSNSQDLKFPINFSPYESLGGEEGLAMLFGTFQKEVKTAAMPLDTAFHLISQSMKFQRNYGLSLLTYLKAIDMHYKNSTKHLKKSTLLKECNRRELLFLEVECPEELATLNIKILGLEHEIKRSAHSHNSISLANAIQLYLASMYTLLLAYLATREFSVLLLKRNCFERSPLDDLCDVKFKQQKSSTFNLLQTIHRPIPSQIYDLGLQYCEFSQYLEQRYGIYHDDDESYLFTNFHNVKKLITRHFCPMDEDYIPEHLYPDLMQSCLNYFSDWSEVPVLDGKRWYATEHQFRRLFAILYFNLTNEEGIEELSWFMGHENLDMTFGYAEMNPSSEWMDEAIITIAKRASKINENLSVDKAIENILELAKEKSLKLNLQLEDVVYQAINQRIKKTGEEVHFKRCEDKTIYFYFIEGSDNA